MKEAKQCCVYMVNSRKVNGTQILRATLEDTTVRPAESHDRSHPIKVETGTKGCPSVEHAVKKSHNVAIM